MLNRVRMWLRSVLLRGRLEREMQEEMAAHLERSKARLMGRGLTGEDARHAALREFGNLSSLQEKARDARGAQWLDALTADVRFAWRQFARRPALTMTMFVILAAGMSISTLLFSYVHSYAVAPPRGVQLADDLVRIRGSRTAGADGRVFRTFSEEEFREYEKMTEQFAAVAGWTDARVTVDASAQDRRGLEAAVSFVSGSYFRVLGVQPLIGAGLPSVDANAATVAVINHTMWVQLFAQDPGILGSILTVNGQPFTIVGVAPEGFGGVAMASTGLKLWLPLSARQLLLPGAQHEFRAAARLNEGVSIEQATSAAAVVAARVASANPQLEALEPSTEVVPLLSANGDPMFERDVRAMGFAVGLLALLVLAVTCTNVSGLLTGLATGRRHEIAIRLSLGAARGRLIRQLLTESVVLATGSAIAAIFLVWFGLRSVSVLVAEFPFDLGITWPATLFTFGVALAVGVLFGLSPALHATRLAIAVALRSSAAAVTAARGRLQRGLVVAQIALTQPLMVLLAGVLMLVFTNLQPQSRTQLADRVVTLSLRAASNSTGSLPDAAQARQQHAAAVKRVREQLQSVPGVTQAITTWRFMEPLGTYKVHERDRAGGNDEPVVQLGGEWVAPGYFGVLGIPIVRGRDFEAHEFSNVESPGVVSVIISSDLARTLWHGIDPIGKRLLPSTDSTNGSHALVVVGVTNDPVAENRKPGQDYRVYLPPDTGWSPSILLRTAQPALPLLGALRKVAQEEAPGMIVTVNTLAAIESGQRKIYNMVTGGISAAGVAALLLSAIGLYAVVAFSVAQRIREIAIRVAVGGRASQIVRRFITDGLALSLFGLMIGLPISMLGLRILIATVPDIPRVPLLPVAAIAALGVFVVAMAAGWLPARRAAAVDPAITLRAAD